MTEQSDFEEKQRRILHKLDMKIILYFLLLFAVIVAVCIFLMWFSFTAGFEKGYEYCLRGEQLGVLKQIPCPITQPTTINITNITPTS